MNQNLPNWLQHSLLTYKSPRGSSLSERYSPLEDWIDARRANSAWPFSRVISGRPGTTSDVADEYGRNQRVRLSFGSQDYLSLSTHERVVAAAKEACDRYGVHSSSSSIVAGRVEATLELERRLASCFNAQACCVYPTGWSAGFGVIAGLANEADSVVIDQLGHSCIMEGALHATTNIHRFRHNDLGRLEFALKLAREANPSNGVFVVIESLYSMESDSPDLTEFVKLARRYEAITILDVAHDFGSCGQGLGLLEGHSPDDWPEVIMGSFSKTFASNGGFVVSTKPVVDYLRCFSPSFTFSNALSPVQASVVNACLDIVFSEEGQHLRGLLLDNSEALRNGMSSLGFSVAGAPSPIVPVFVGGDSLSRLAARHLERFGIMTSYAEYPVVPEGKARFRFQLRPNYRSEEIEAGCRYLAEAVEAASKELGLLSNGLPA